jgi:predicted Zn-dependent peptidase
MIEDTPDEYVHILFQEAFWKDNPLGLPIYGSVESVEKTDRDSMLRYLAKAFRPERIVIAAAGNIEHERFIDLVAPHMESLNHSGLAVPRETPTVRRHIGIIRKDLEQVHLCLGLPGTSLVDENRLACHLLNVILGSSMSSRLFQEIREKRGLAYSVYSFVNSHVDTGMLGVYAGIAPENVREVLRLLRDQLALLASEPIPAAELSAAKEYLRGSMYLNAESTDSRMNRLAKNEFLFGRHIPFEEVEAKISHVTSEAVLAWFRDAYHPSRISLMLFGPVDMDVAEVEQVILEG